MTYKIHKNGHQGWPLPIGLYWAKREMTRKVILGFDGIYKHDDPEDQQDVNKLFGIAYVHGFHKHNGNWNADDSARWGWRYNLTTKLYEYCNYCHVNKDVFFQPVCSLTAAHNPILRLLIEPKKYIFIAYDGDQPTKVIGELQQPYDHNKKLSYKKGPWFGGNIATKKEIKIQLKKV